MAVLNFQVNKNGEFINKHNNYEKPKD